MLMLKFIRYVRRHTSLIHVPRHALIKHAEGSRQLNGSIRASKYCYISRLSIEFIITKTKLTYYKKQLH